MATIGQAVSRVGGPLKVTGGAAYAYEHSTLIAGIDDPTAAVVEGLSQQRSSL